MTSLVVTTRHVIRRGFHDSLGLVGRSLHTATAGAHLCFSETQDLVGAQRMGVDVPSDEAGDGGGGGSSSSSSSHQAQTQRVAALELHFALIEENLSDALRYAETGRAGLKQLVAAIQPAGTSAPASAAGAVVDDSLGGGGSGGGNAVISGGTFATSVAAQVEEEPEQDRLFEAYTGPLEPYSPFDDDTLTSEQQKAAWKEERAARKRERATAHAAQARSRAGLDNSKAVLHELRAVLGGLSSSGAGGGSGGRGSG